MKKKYDVFVSHAVDDKASIANELVCRLKQKGLCVWYSGADLSAGGDLTDLIMKGLANSASAIVIISHNFKNKSWTVQEMGAMMFKGLPIFPVLHGMTFSELKEFSPKLAETIFVSSEKGLDFVVDKIVPQIKTEVRSHVKKKLRMVSVPIILAVVAVLAWWQFMLSRQPPSTVITNAIETRIATLDSPLEFERSRANDSTEALALYNKYMGMHTRYTNEYAHSDGTNTVSAKKNVEDLLQINADLLTPEYRFSLDSAFTQLECDADSLQCTIRCLNLKPVTYKIVDENRLRDNQYEVVVQFDQGIRSVSTMLHIPLTTEGRRYKRVVVYGLLPQEAFLFEKTDTGWKLIEQID